MGGGASTLRSQGYLPSPEVRLPSSVVVPVPPSQTVSLVLPRGAKPGSRQSALTPHGDEVIFVTPEGKRAGDTITLDIGPDPSGIIASTLPAVPGHNIVASKPIVYASTSVSFTAADYNHGASAEQLTGLSVQNQVALKKQAIALGCNAVLGITFTMANDSSGEHGRYKGVIMMSFGTPCVVAPQAAAAVAQAAVAVA